MQAGYEIEDAVPSLEDYRRVRAAAGLSPKSDEAAASGLPNTLFGVVVRRDGRVVAMGRLMGDGGLFFQIVDIAVDPPHQRRGLGRGIVGRLVEHVRRTAHPGAHVSLLADGEAHRLYEQFGCAPTAPASIGMAFSIW